MNFVILLCATVLSCTSVFAVTRVRVYQHAKYKGKSFETPDLNGIRYATLGKLNDKTTSYKITRGSCAEMHMHIPPRYNSYYDYFRTGTIENHNVGSTYNDRISSIKACEQHTVSMQCPSGTFAKKVQWDNTNRLRNGIKIYCYTPESKQARRVLGYGNFRGNMECNAVRGIRFIQDIILEAYVGMEPLCQQRSPQNHLIQLCENGKALTGVLLQVETHTRFIKSASIVCKNVGKIEKTCKPEDKWSVLLTCDASVALHSLSCTRAKTVGYGYSKSLSEEKRTEQNFYKELGFEIGTAGFGLSATFKATLGSSTTTGYSWAATEESTFHQEETITVQVEAPSGCKTRIEEIIGECSFITVSPNHYRRRDECRNVTYLTNVKIPRKIGKAAVFLSKIPDEIMKLKTA